jgi:membrane-bound serine protease (ClpP class)
MRRHRLTPPFQSFRKAIDQRARGNRARGALASNITTSKPASRPNAMRLIAYAFMVTLGLASAWSATGQENVLQDPTPHAYVIPFDGAIGPASADYFRKSIDRAVAQGAAIAIIEIDTPGGLVTSTRDIIKTILASPIPIATYVAPQGAHAASAGTYILYASHIAAMAPSTNVGAATPIELGGGQGTPFGDDNSDKMSEDDDDGETASKEKSPAPDGTASLKAVNDLVAFIKGLAKQRGRNVDWAEKSVREAASLPATEALKLNVIDIVAVSVPDLLRQADGMVVTVGEKEVTLDTADAHIERHVMSWITKFLLLITDPNVAFIFMTLGTYGLFFELANPGSVFPGVIGAICILLGLYALSVLPVSFAGAAFLILGIALLAAEIFSPSFGILGIGGLTSFALGATMLFDTDSPEFRLSWEVIVGTTVATGVFFAFVAAFAVAAMRRAIVAGTEDLIGGKAVVTEWEDGRGYVHADGERWRARSNDQIGIGDTVIIERIEGLELVVRSAKS